MFIAQPAALVLSLTFDFLLLSRLALRCCGATAMTWVPPYRPGRRRSPVATIRLVALLGILAMLVIRQGLGLDMKLPSMPVLASAGGRQFTLCDRGNRAQCVVDGDTIYYGG